MLIRRSDDNLIELKNDSKLQRLVFQYLVKQKIITSSENNNSFYLIEKSCGIMDHNLMIMRPHTGTCLEVVCGRKGVHVRT